MIPRYLDTIRKQDLWECFSSFLNLQSIPLDCYVATGGDANPAKIATRADLFHRMTRFILLLCVLLRLPVSAILYLHFFTLSTAAGFSLKRNFECGR